MNKPGFVTYEEEAADLEASAKQDRARAETLLARAFKSEARAKECRFLANIIKQEVYGPKLVVDYTPEHP